MSTGKYHVVSEPMENSDSITILRAFRDLLQSAMGPSGRLKLLVTGGGYFIVTSSSTRILNYLALDNPICIFISQIMKSHLAEFKDNGLYIGVLSSSLLIQTLSLSTISTMVATDILQKMCNEIATLLNFLKIQIDFSTVTQLIPIVRSVVHSKPACSLTSSEADDLVIAVVKAFLDSASDKNIGDVFVVAGERSGLVSSTFSGVVYQLGLFQTNDSILSSFTNPTNAKMYSLLLFNIMLSEEKTEKRRETDRVAINPDYQILYNVQTTMQVMRYAVELGVNIVACQKVVDPLIKLFLRRNGILLLDRMGTQLTDQIELLSGAVPISDFSKCLDKESLFPLLGHVSSVRRIQRGKKDYVTLERDNRNVMTLLAGGINAEASAELKVTTEQALESLRQLLSEPYILPGAGCTEMAVVAGLTANVNANGSEYYHCSESQLQSSLLVLQKSLLSAVGFSKSELLTLSADTAFYHAWQNTDTDEWSTCRCGLVNASMVRRAQKNWVNLDWNSGVLLSECETPMKLSVKSLHNKAVVDVFSCKYNAVKLSSECFSSLAGIGMILYKHRE